MMREIKFRGKRLEDGKWIYGNLIVASDGKCLIQPWLRTDGVGYTHPTENTGEVDPDTIGQFTGINSKIGKEIYEGDIVKESKSIGVIVYDSDRFMIDWKHDVDFYNEILRNHSEYLQVIGNIYENPDLIQL